jgi:hypothetical protein
VIVMTDDARQTAPEVATQAPAAADPPASPRTPQPPSRRVPRALIVTLAVVAALAVALTFSPVRTLAAQMLSVFRVQKIATVSISQDDLTKIGQAFEKGDANISLDELGSVQFDGKPGLGSEAPTLTTLAAAQAAVDFPITAPTGVEGTQSVLIQPGYDIKFKLNIDKVNELLRYYGAEKTFSKSLDGKQFEIKMAPTVFLTYGKSPLGFSAESSGDMMSEEGTPTFTPDPYSQDIFVVQTRGPQIVVPDGVNPLEIRDVLLNLPFIPETIKSQLASVSDWQNTLLIPNISGSTKDITVAGNPGVMISQPTDPDMTASPDDSKPPVAVMWQKDGVIRAVATTDKAKSLTLAESMAK